MRSFGQFTRLIDPLVLFLVMPPLGFIVSLSQSPLLRYLTEYYIVAALIVAAIIIRCRHRVFSRQLILRLLLTTLMTAIFLFIEWFHFLLGKPSIDFLHDIRMIVYSPLYGTIIIFVLYAMYLVLLDDVGVKKHFSQFVSLMCWFHTCFLGYWFFLFFGWLPEIPNTAFLRANSYAYSALFLICLLSFYHKSFGVSGLPRLLFVGLNILLIFLLQTRGAILGVCVLGAYYALHRVCRLSRGWSVILIFGALIYFPCIVILLGRSVLVSVFGEDVSLLYDLFNQIEAMLSFGHGVVSINPFLSIDEKVLSALSRIGSNYASVISLLEAPWLGVGQKEAYDINIIGSHVHSLHLLILNATGVIGFILFLGILLSLSFSRERILVSWTYVLTLCINFGLSLLFVNSLPIYLAFLFVVLPRGKSSHKNADITNRRAVVVST